MKICTFLLNLKWSLEPSLSDGQKVLTTAVNLWTRNLVIRQRVEDFQLGIESYQTQLNLTKPRWDAPLDFEFKLTTTVIDSPGSYIQRQIRGADDYEDEYKILDEERRCQKQGVLYVSEKAKRDQYLSESRELCWWTDSRRRLPVTEENRMRGSKYGDSDGYTFDDPILILEILSRRFLLRGIYLITGSSKDGDGDTSF
ncbi:hypothetical protein Tco_1020517 [Tanacetum coccineum]